VTGGLDVPEGAELLPLVWETTGAVVEVGAGAAADPLLEVVTEEGALYPLAEPVDDAPVTGAEPEPEARAA
jgi:hypothetical protein